MLRSALVVSFLMVGAALLLVPSASAQSSLCNGDFVTNDCFRDSQFFVQPFYQNVSTEGATLESGEPRPCGAIGATKWYRFTASQNGTAVVSTVASPSPYDSVLAVYTGSNLTALSLQGCNDDAVGLRAQLTFECVAGTIYRIQLGGFNGAVGETTLTVSGCGTVNPPAPPNLFSASFSEPGVSLAWSKPSDGGAPLMGYELYRSLDGGEPDLHAVLDAFTTSFFDDGLPSQQTASYAVRASNAMGPGGLSQTRSGQIPCFSSFNDCISEANAIGTARPADFSGNTTGATIEKNEPATCGTVSHSTWHRFTAQTDGTARIERTSEASGGLITVFAGLSDWLGCRALSAVPPLEFTCTKGTTYWIQVATVEGLGVGYAFRLTGCGAEGITTDTAGSDVGARYHEGESVGSSTTGAGLDVDGELLISRSGDLDGKLAEGETRVYARSPVSGSAEKVGLFLIAPPPPPGPGPSGDEVRSWAIATQQWALAAVSNGDVALLINPPPPPGPGPSGDEIRVWTVQVRSWATNAAGSGNVALLLNPPPPPGPGPSGDEVRAWGQAMAGWAANVASSGDVALLINPPPPPGPGPSGNEAITYAQAVGSWAANTVQVG